MARLAAVKPQASIFEATIENAVIEDALEEREKIKAKRKAATKAMKEAHEKVKVLLDQEDLGLEAPVRIGRFIVTRKKTLGKPVEFTTSDSEKLQISLIPDLP